jgi:D-3-phosphoglycerate dehydrogenase
LEDIMTWRVLVSAPYFLPVIEEYRQQLLDEGVELIPATVHERLSEEELLAVIGDIDGIICGDDRLTERVLEAAPRLKVISKWGTGIDSIDKAAAEKRGIAVCRTPNAFTLPVADTVLGYILCFARQLPWMDRDIRAAIWHKRPSVSLSESTLGVIGVGNIGKAVVRRALAFGMRVLGHDTAPLPWDFVAETKLDVTSLDDLLATADFVSINCDLNPTSYHLLNERTLALMKPTAYLINTARGPIIEEQALIAALQSQRIAGAALDVFEDEPLPQNSPLRVYDTCMFAPHNSNSSPAAWQRVHEMTIRNLLDVLHAI